MDAVGIEGVKGVEKGTLRCPHCHHLPYNTIPPHILPLVAIPQRKMHHSRHFEPVLLLGEQHLGGRDGEPPLTFHPANFSLVPYCLWKFCLGMIGLGEEEEEEAGLNQHLPVL